MMTERVDREGRWIVVASETCRACGRDSREIHPAGVVVASNWRCSCGHRQGERLQVRQRVMVSVFVPFSHHTTPMENYDVRLSDLANDFEQSMRRRDLSPRTIAAYHWALNALTLIGHLRRQSGLSVGVAGGGEIDLRD